MDLVLRIKTQVLSVFVTPLLRGGGSSSLFKSLEEAGCVARESAFG